MSTFVTEITNTMLIREYRGKEKKVSKGRSVHYLNRLTHQSLRESGSPVQPIAFLLINIVFNAETQNCSLPIRFFVGDTPWGKRPSVCGYAVEGHVLRQINNTAERIIICPTNYVLIVKSQCTHCSLFHSYCIFYWYHFLLCVIIVIIV